MMDSSLSSKFLEVDLKLTAICYHPKEVLVKFQGQYYTECEFDYHILQNEIQQVPKVKDIIGIGEVCLVEDPDCGEWYRGRVVQKKNHTIYEVFLMDSGKVLVVHETHIASPTDVLFQLPPKMVFGIFANILPFDEKWTPKALNYFSSLRNLQIKGQIQAILPHQTFLLDVPKITSDVVDLKLGKVVDGDTFHLIVEMLTEFPKESLCKQMPDLLQQKYTRPDSVLFSAGTEPEQILKSLQLLLPVGRVEKVKIAVAVSPSKFYCQLLRQEMDLDKLTTHMSSCYETISRENVMSFENLGVLCAARRKNGQWHRGMIQQVLSDNKVKVWFMDFGSCEVVTSRYVLKLQPEFISFPRFSFTCALSCLNDPDETVRHNQLQIFKEVLLRQGAVYAQIDLFHADEYLYYVTLHKNSTVNTEDLQGSDAVLKCSLSFNKETSCTRGDTTSAAGLALSQSCYRNTLQSGHSADKNDSPLMCSLKMPCERAEMKIDSVCLAFIVYILNPSDFWIQTNDCQEKFEAMMKKITDVYDEDETEDKILENPEPGKLCCARYGKDKHFYRAVINEVADRSASISFLDFGNIEIVPLFDLRILLPEFQELPALAIYCSLHNAVPIEDVWTNKEIDFFKTIVAGKLLTLHPVAKQGDKYIVSVQCTNGSEQNDVLKLMIQAGHALYWEVKEDPLLKVIRGFQYRSKSKYNYAKHKSHTKENKSVICNSAGQNEKLLNIHPAVKEPVFTSRQQESSLSNKHGKAFGKAVIQKHYKEYLFKPGTVLDVVCCHSISPGHFSCQIQNKLPELNNLMKQIQFHYNTKKKPYEPGEVACVVKHSKDGKWYRAAVLNHFSKNEVDVVFVDYGNRERVLLKDLQAILPEFLTLECQSFTCSLNGVTKSLIFDPCNWTEEAYDDFQQFVSSSNGLLTCTISVLIVKSPNYVYNVVDLQTPFTSLQQFLLERGHIQFGSFQFARSLSPLFSQCSFYYSSFNMKIGNEEEVCVTHICSPTKFYCQLNRNAEDIDKLLKKIAEISCMTNSTDQVSTSTLWLAKYFEDGLFYRALAFPVESSDYYQVDFVDFGNKQLVPKNELIPIPNHASEIFFTPVQAIKCYLSDLKDREIPVEINKWFEKNYLGRDLKAVIVTKEADGQLGVELYDKDLQINGRIKQLLKENKVDRDPKIKARSGEYSARKEKIQPEVRLGADKTNIKNVVVRRNKETENKAMPCYLGGEELHVECGEGSIELQKRSVKLPAISENTGKLVQSVDCSSKKSDVLENNMTSLHMLKSRPFEQERNSTSREKYTNLKQHNIQPNTKILGYISFATSPSDFYIHCAEDEDTVVNLAEILNGGTVALEPENDDLEEGDIVLAEYEHDCCVYRAAVKRVESKEYFEIEFIDYGNTTTVSASQIYKMEKDFLNFPRLSIHCFLNKTKCIFPDKDWSTDTAAYFVSKVNNQLLIVEFFQQHGQQWEVDLFCNGVPITRELMQREISIALQKMSVSNQVQVAKQLIRADTDIDDDCHTKKEIKNAWERLPKIAYQKIKPGQREIGEIEHISKNGDFFVKLNKDAQILLDLNVMAAQEARKNSFLEVENIKEGLECLTKSQATLKWYRSEIIKKSANEEYVLVFFMDLGKFEMVSVNEVQMLNDKIRSIPRNAVPCKWVWIGNLDSLSFENVAAKIKPHLTEFLFLKYLESASVWEVEILIDGILLLEYWNRLLLVQSLERANVSGNILVDKTVPELFRPNFVSWTSFKIPGHYAGCVVSVTDPSDFCVQIEDSFKTLKTLFMLLSDLPENLPSVPQEFIVPGSCCLIKTGYNAEWNRVEVAEVSKVSSMLKINFIDDGLSASLPISDISKLKVIPEKLACLPRLTYPSCLFGVSPADGNHWNHEAKLKIQEFFGREGLTFHLRQQHHGLKLEVDVLCKQDNAADTLVASGCAVYTKTTFFSDSIHCVNTSSLNSQNLCEHSLTGDRNTNAEIVPSDKEVNPDFRCICGKSSRQNCSKKLHSKNKGDQKAFPCSNQRKSENQLKYDRNVFKQPCDRELKQSYSIGLLSKAVPEISAVSELTVKIDGMQIQEESRNT